VKVTEVQVGLASCGVAAGAEVVFNQFRKILGSKVVVKPVGCLGMCYNEPLVAVITDSGERFLYKRVDAALAKRIAEEHVKGGTPLEDFLAPDDGFFKRQVRIVLENCGQIAPTSVEEYRERGGYEALRRAIQEMTPQEVIVEIQQSGLRGRGGAAQGLISAPFPIFLNGSWRDLAAILENNADLTFEETVIMGKEILKRGSPFHMLFRYAFGQSCIDPFVKETLAGTRYYGHQRLVVAHP